MGNTAVHATSVQRSEADYVTTNTTQWRLHKKHTTSTTGDYIRNNGRAYITHACRTDKLAKLLLYQDCDRLESPGQHHRPCHLFSAFQGPSCGHTTPAGRQRAVPAPLQHYARLLDEAVYISSSSFFECPKSCWLFWHFRWCSGSPHFSSGHKS